MKSTLERWLLDGEPLPEGFDVAHALQNHPEYAGLVSDLERIDAYTHDLPLLQAPATDDAWLQHITNQPQVPTVPNALETNPPTVGRIANTRMWVSVLVAVAAMVFFFLVPQTRLDQEGAGDPSQWTERGLDPGLGPEIHLRIAVQRNMGSPARFTRGAFYGAGDTLFFNVDTPASGTVQLIRVDTQGVSVLHAQAIRAGSENLQTPQGSIGYELESGEPSAVFAIVRFENAPSTETLLQEIPNEANVDTVCAAVRSIGGRCAAERVEAVQ